MKKLLPDEENPLLSNRTIAAHARDSERFVIAKRVTPIDLRSLPRDRWDEFIDFHLTLPPRLLDGFDPGPLPADSIEALEDAVARFHGITEPYFVAIDTQLEKTGRAWRYEPDAAAFLTGFRLDRDGDSSLHKDAKP
ncbi:MAG: hypothetical protein QOE70_4021 [Chthoniobacter sp.]|jgi:hypothetical protein|nr:hypothetical protein [Chthoniobacter sp.]